jgi:hypothetical protein
VPAAAVFAMLSGPTGSTTGSLYSVPVGLVAVIGSFLLFVLGTLAALTKHRWNRIDWLGANTGVLPSGDGGGGFEPPLPSGRHCAFTKAGYCVTQ